MFRLAFPRHFEHKWGVRWRPYALRVPQKTPLGGIR